MSETTSRASKWLAQRDPIPEMEMEDLRRLLKGRFEILSEIEPRQKQYWLRFMGKPYNAAVQDCRSVRVMAHNRGTKVSPYHIKHILEKFGIEESDFRAAYNVFFSQVAVAATGTDSDKPN